MRTALGIGRTGAEAGGNNAKSLGISRILGMLHGLFFGTT